MGKKVHNVKGRKNPKIEVDNSAVKKIQIELDASTSGTGYDEANALVLPSRKRATKIVVVKKQHTKILTKKQRKHLQSIVDKKKKKHGRTQLLEALATMQIPDNELQQYTSISQAQTVGTGKVQTLDELIARKHKKQLKQNLVTKCNSSIKGAVKRSLLIEDEEEIAAKRRDPNFVGYDDDEGDVDEDDNDEDDDDDDDKYDDDGEGSKKDQSNDDQDKIVVKLSNVETEKMKTTSGPAMSGKKTQIAVEDKSTPSSYIQATNVRSTIYIHVDRSAEIQALRLKLPILAEEQQIMETINENSIIIIAGETGSGKTTQVPQFLYESGYAEEGKLIGITEPRRVAAIAMAKRVADEMNLSHREVSYLIRYEGNVTVETRIKFMTDGVLLKEIESDFLLLKYSVIILDEAHERSAYTDILVGLLSRIVPTREKRGNPLKLIIMSATLRVEDFTCNSRLFKTPPPLLKVESRQFPVTVHFQKYTPSDYIAEAFRKTVKIHAQLPEGGILIFLTGQHEVNQLVRKLRRTFPLVKGNDKSEKHKCRSAEGKNNATCTNSKTDNFNDEDSLDAQFDNLRAKLKVKNSKKNFFAQINLPKIDLDDYNLPGDDTEADLYDANNVGDENAFGGDEDELDEDFNTIENAPGTQQPLWVLPLYSLLSSEKQNRIFQPAPEGCRLCIVSTNVAETSLTIPNVKYVVDSGRHKVRVYDKITGVSAFVVTYTSKASAEQRAGRAGRMSAGHCYRLYSSAVFNDEFEKFSLPDIQQKPVDNLMLQMRCIGIDRVINFPFPSPPDVVQLQAAEQRLVILGALKRVGNTKAPNEREATKELTTIVTKLGQVISRYPVAPRFGKMLSLSHQQNLLPYTVCLVAALSVQEVLQESNFEHDQASCGNKWKRKRMCWSSTGNFQLLGDPMVLLRAVGAAEYAGVQNKLAEFCKDNGLRPKAISEVRKLRLQLTNDINLSIKDVDLIVDPRMPPPSDEQARYLRQILLAGMGDRVARKLTLTDVSDKEEKRRLRYAYNCADMEAPVFMHSSSVLKQKLPEWVVYQEAYELQNGDTSKMFIRGITAIEPEWLLLYVPLLCNIRNVRDDPLPRYNTSDGKVYCFVDATFSKAGWELPLAEIEMPPSEKACSYFAMFLLDGLVCQKLAQFKSKLKSTPSSIVKSWSNLNEKIVRFKRLLFAKQIFSRAQLFDIWADDPNFLLDEYYNLLHDVPYTELTLFWPPLEM